MSIETLLCDRNSSERGRYKRGKKLRWCHVAQIVQVVCLHVRLSERPSSRSTSEGSVNVDFTRVARAAGQFERLYHLIGNPWVVFIQRQKQMEIIWAGLLVDHGGLCFSASHMFQKRHKGWYMEDFVETGSSQHLFLCSWTSSLRFVQASFYPLYLKS